MTVAVVSSRDGAAAQTAFYSRLYKPNGAKKGIVFSPGGGGQDWPIGDQTTNLEVEAGYPHMFITADWLFGNATHRARFAAARSALISSFGATNGKVILLGASMGGVGCLNFALFNPTLVQAIVLSAPAISVQDIYDNNRGGNSANVAAAYGGGRPPDAENPASNPNVFMPIPIAIWYSTDDPICDAGVATTFGTATGAAMHSVGAQGHRADVPPADMLAFIEAHS